MNDAVLEVVDDHVYLGSIISEKGRKKDLSQRIIDCKGAANEIVEISKTGGVNELRLHFMKMLIDIKLLKPVLFMAVVMLKQNWDPGFLGTLQFSVQSVFWNYN